MVDLGTLILALACRHPVTASSRGDSLAFMAQHYSPELHNLAASLVSKPPTVYEVRRAMEIGLNTLWEGMNTRRSVAETPC